MGVELILKYATDNIELFENISLFVLFVLFVVMRKYAPLFPLAKVL